MYIRKTNSQFISSYTMKTADLFITHFIYAIQLLLPTKVQGFIHAKLVTEKWLASGLGHYLSKFRSTVNEMRDVQPQTPLLHNCLPQTPTRGSAGSSHRASLDPSPAVSPHPCLILPILFIRARDKSSWTIVELQHSGVSPG